jgi:glycerol-3-phosphate dehydrogenase
MRRSGLDALRSGTSFDLLVIGGGATGCGIALDAATRGLKTALVERGDFAEGTSSRSTKLIHGGVRYLEAAVRKLDRVQYGLVRHALHERGAFIANAPHLCDRRALLTPLYSWMQVPYVYAGLKLYDLLSGRRNIGHSTLIGRGEALRRFPMLKAQGLKAAVVYYDGQFIDSRMVVALAQTARRAGATLATRVEVVGLPHDANGRLAGVAVRDRLSGESWTVRARAVINATGPFADRLRRLDNPAARPILKVSSGVHIVLDKKFVPPETGLLIPRTDDGRVLFILPWQGHALVGTTDDPAEVCDRPRPTDDEVRYLLGYVRRYFNLDVAEADVKSVWSGIRPLVFDPDAADTAQLARDHVILEDPSGLITISGGKWTTYRFMAEQAVDRAIRAADLAGAGPCRTGVLRLVGAEGYDPQGAQALARQYGLAADVASHLNRFYGDRASVIAQLAQDGWGARLHPDHPFIEAEVLNAVRDEDALGVADVLCRRLTLALLDRAAAGRAASRVAALMAAELGWDEARRERELADFTEELASAI